MAGGSTPTPTPSPSGGLGGVVGSGKPIPTSGNKTGMTPGAPPSPQGAGILSDAAIAAAIAAGQKEESSVRIPTVSSYDQKNNFYVPLTASHPGYYGSQFGEIPGMSMALDVALNSGFFAVTDPTLRQLVVDAAGGDPLKYDTIWKSAVARVAYASQGGNTDITVDSLLRKWGKSGVPDGILNGGGGGASGGPFRTINRQVSLTDRGTANQIVNGALSRYLGREATDIEQRAFLKALNVQEKANPVTSVTEGVQSGMNRTSSTTASGGFNRDDFAQKFAQSQEGYAEFQTATTYLDAFIDSLENPMRAI